MSYRKKSIAYGINALHFHATATNDQLPAPYPRGYTKKVNKRNYMQTAYLEFVDR